MLFNLGGYNFEGPFHSVEYLQNEPGIYIISCKTNHSWSVMEIGQSGHVEAHCRSFIQSDRGRIECSTGTIYFSAHYMPHTTAGDRIMIERDIRSLADLECV